MYNGVWDETAIVALANKSAVVAAAKHPQDVKVKVTDSKSDKAVAKKRRIDLDEYENESGLYSEL